MRSLLSNYRAIYLGRQQWSLFGMQSEEAVSPVTHDRLCLLDSTSPRLLATYCLTLSKDLCTTAGAPAAMSNRSPCNAYSGHLASGQQLLMWKHPLMYSSPKQIICWVYWLGRGAGKHGLHPLPGGPSFTGRFSFVVRCLSTMPPSGEAWHQDMTAAAGQVRWPEWPASAA